MARGYTEGTIGFSVIQSIRIDINLYKSYVVAIHAEAYLINLFILFRVTLIVNFWLVFIVFLEERNREI